MRGGAARSILACAFAAACAASSSGPAGWVSSARADASVSAELLPLDSVAPRERSPEGSQRQPSPEGRRATAPRIRLGVVEATRGIPLEVIRRILRQSYGRFRLCYEQGLARRPKLEGNVEVGFVVERDGRTSRSRDGGSTLPDAAVVRCIVSAVGGLSFPRLEGDWAAPEGGTMRVLVQLRLSPE